MKYIISVSKMYKHGGKYINHLTKTKKYWHIIYHEYDEYNETWKMGCKQVSWITAMYYKLHKWKKINLTCPDCKTTYLHFIKKRTVKHILKEACPNCLESYKTILENQE